MLICTPDRAFQTGLFCGKSAVAALHDMRQKVAVMETLHVLRRVESPLASQARQPSWG